MVRGRQDVLGRHGRLGDFAAEAVSASDDAAARKAAAFWSEMERHRKRPWRLVAAIGPMTLLRFVTGRLTLDVRNRLEQLAEDPDARVRAAAGAAVGRIDTIRRVYGGVETLFFGLSLGSVLVLAAIGLAITFGVMGVINMAHGEFLMLGAYTTYVVQTLLPGHLDWSMLRDADQLALVIARHPQVERVVCGHVHRAVQQRWAGTLVQTAPGIAHQAELMFGEGRGGWICEPPAVTVTPRGLLPST